MRSNEDLALTWAVAEIVELASIRRRLASGRKLTIKLGVDPTAKDLHLGHAVVLRKLRQFQDLGHQAVLVIGDFTARIGDPSGKSATRSAVGEREIRTNMKSYAEQAKLILDLKKTKIVYNSQWLGKMSLANFLAVATKLSVSTVLEREDFAKRLESQQFLGLHELLYPVCQAIDSVELRADVEIGGWDQRLNLLLGRELQKKMDQQPQEVVTLQALIGLDGSQKMSKSLGNYIGLTESPDQMFGKVMSVPDSLTVQYGVLAALIGDEREAKQQLSALHPRDQKALVAEKIVALYHGAVAAKKALQNFNQTFRDKKIADHLAAKLLFSQQSVALLHAVAEAAECSNSQAGRLISQGAVKLEGVKMTDPNFEIELTDELLLQIGKHVFRQLGQRK